MKIIYNYAYGRLPVKTTVFSKHQKIARKYVLVSDRTSIVFEHFYVCKICNYLSVQYSGDSKSYIQYFTMFSELRSP